MRIIYRLYADYIMYYLSPPHGDNRDNAKVFSGQKKGFSKFGGPPPQKFCSPVFTGPPYYGKRRR